MAKKKQFDYFEALVTLAKNGHEAAILLEEIILNYQPENLEEKSEGIHILERENDQVMSEISHQLYVSFITPIDREDLYIIKEQLDDIIDGINATSYLFENLVVERIRPGTEVLAEYIVKATEAVAIVAQEFSKFKNSKTLAKMIQRVNEIESEADVAYSRLVKELFSKEADPIEIIRWKEVFDHLETIINQSEKAADVMAGLVIKNT